RWIVQESRRNRLDVKVVPDLLGFEPRLVLLEHFGGIPVLGLHQERIPAAGLFVKRMVDLMGSAMALVIVAPLLGAIALAVKLDSPGPVFYRAQRVGRKGRSFAFLKFRSMVADADRRKDDLRRQNERSGPFFKITRDPRITAVGSFLRRYSL